MDTLCAVNDKGLGRITPGATCGRNSVYLVVSDSSLAQISGGKKNRKRADLAQDMNYNRSTSCSHCEVRMCWKGLHISHVDSEERPEGPQETS